MAGASNLKPAEDASVEALLKTLEQSPKPVLWVGAGLSIAAGYPSAKSLADAIRAKADAEIPAGLSFTHVADLFIQSNSPGELADVLQQQIGAARQPTAAHHALARLARAGCFETIVTTNYDDLLERALQDEGVTLIVQSLHSNQSVSGAGLRLLKVHGSRDDWQNVVLSGRSYDEFELRYQFVLSQLDLLLARHRVLFLGCSLQDPRVYSWLERIKSTPVAANLKLWPALLTRPDWDAALAATWNGRTGADLLGVAPLKPLILRDHGALPDLLAAAADRLAPPLSAQIEPSFEVGDACRAKWGAESWTVADPLADKSFAERLALLRKWSPTSGRSATSSRRARKRRSIANWRAVGRRGKRCERLGACRLSR